MLSTLLPNIENSEFENEDEKETKIKKGKLRKASPVYCKTSALIQGRMWKLHVLKLQISIRRVYGKSTKKKA